MKKQINRPMALFCFLTALALFFGAGSFLYATKWVGKTIPGFWVYPIPYVGSMRVSDWPGPQQGLRIYDRIYAVEGERVRWGKEVLDRAGAEKPGTPLRYLVDTKGLEREVTVPVMTYTLRDFFLVFTVPFFGGFIVLLIGVVAFLLKPNTRTTWVFFGLCFNLSLYMMTSVDIQSDHLFTYYHAVFLNLFPAFFLHLSMIFPERKRLLDRHTHLEYLVYLPAVVLIAAWEAFYLVAHNVADSFGMLWSYGKIAAYSKEFTLVCFIGVIVLLVHSFLKASSAVSRQRALTILFGMFFGGLLPVISMAMSVLVKFEMPWNVLPFLVILIPAVFAYSIVKHNLFDADVLIRRTIGYVVVTIVVIGAYVGVSLGLNVVLGQYELAQSRGFSILFTIGIILVFNPLRNRVQAIVDRVFFRAEYNYTAINEKVGRAMTSLLSLDEILTRLARTFADDMFIDNSTVLLLATGGSEYLVSMAEGEDKEETGKVRIAKDDPLVQTVEREKHVFTKYDFLEDKKYSDISEECAAKFDALHASLIVPLIYQDRVTGLMNLGIKKSGKAYNREDLDLLRSVASQSAVAIENARLFQENLEKQRMEEELNIARDMQMSMLPAECPEVEGFQIAASSVPAKEVGGDFYDFIDIGESRIGMVVGDVTGKSVSGALVMSASRSVFRMLSEEEMGVDDIMARANRRTKADITKGMFVALLYAVLDFRKKTLRLCNAGQTQPVHISGRTGEATLVETDGDTFPIGIVDDPDYQEKCLQLETGDKILLYTDGIVEAMNVKEEMFGFERFLETAKSARAETAEGMRQEIIAAVDEFSAGAEQHDDLTVIVITVQ